MAGFLVVIWATIILSLGREYQTAERDAVQQTGILAHALSDDARRIFVGIDETLLAVRAAYRVSPETFDLVAWNQAQRRPDQLRVQIGLINAAGMTTASTSPTSLVGIDVSDRPHFRAQLDPARDELFISNPLLGRGTGQWTIQLSRKLLHQDGSFAGVAIVSLGLDQFAQFFQPVAAGGIVAIVGTDGIVRARGGPAGAAPAGNDLSNRPYFRDLLRANSGSFRSRTPDDGLQRVSSFQRVTGYPLVVLVGYDDEQVLTGYHATKRRTVVIGAIVSAIVLLFGGFWIFQRQRSARSRLALDVTLGSMGQGLIMVDGNGRVAVINARAKQLLGVPADATDQAVEQTVGELPGVAGGTGARNVLKRDDRIIEVESHAIDEGGFVVTCTDVTERQRDEERIRHLALHDGLTGLANRALLTERLNEAVAAAKVSGMHVGLIALDLDGFKAINDDFGHDVGDRLLIEVAERLRRAVRPCDTVARVGGDEFTIVVRDLPRAETADGIAEQLVAVLNEPVNVLGHRCPTTASAGVTVFPDDEATGETLLKNADIALYCAKEGGRDRFRRFERGMCDAIEERRWLERELRIGVQNNQIEVFFQPQFSPHTRAVTGFEALARWRHPQRGFISPAVFIPIAEESGLIIEIGRLVLERACSVAAEWQPQRRVAVNLSPVQFRHAELPQLVSELLTRTNLPPAMLELEITEGVLISDERQALRILDNLRALGVRLALDDFGIGYSSLSYLHRYPFDRVKIDRSFVQAQQHDPRARAILDAVIAMSHSLGLSITAEGVETEDQLEMLRLQGFTEVQGFLLGRPMPPGEARAFLASASAGPRPRARNLQLATSLGVLQAH
ncbi:MAG: EAL domain-containing protein [Acidisphaera sp.]|nr:EAL domain-containing protein [Acidisphaera sp.]MBV9813837.1 EAL domain-containing protein [Acetobacteraceae bacterium]